MITQSYTLGQIPANLPQSFPDPAGVCFLDIETSGYARKNARLCYAGCICPKDGLWSVRQWILESKEDELLLLNLLAEHLSPWPVLAHFGGTSFDLPFLKKKFQAAKIPFDFGVSESFDLYRMLRPYQKLFRLEHMDQKTLEGFLGLRRGPQDNDLTMLPGLLPLLRVTDLLDGNFQVSSCNPLDTDTGFQCELRLRTPEPLPVPLSHLCKDFYLKAEGRDVRLLVYGFRGTLKYFFPDYRNYYYLPAEDQAVHRSVAAYVEKENRVPAKAATCYIKKDGCFLPAPTPLSSQLFRAEYKSPDCWMLFPLEWEEKPEAAYPYAASLLSSAELRKSFPTCN
ncbi:MAG: ribonuclease H-like domain-containing protein [Eubacteriales bacterium]|nr:ribonuclease H-like domain-containing protein [Eubacteriales bacterium]